MMKSNIIFLLCFSFVLSGNCQITQINTGTNTHLADVSVIDKNILVCGLFNNLVKSYDDCNNISNVLLPGPASYANRLFRIDSNNLYLLSFTPNQSLFYKSTDGGNNWILKLDTTGGWSTQIAFFDSLEGIITAGKHFYRTSDGGDTWTMGS